MAHVMQLIAGIEILGVCLVHLIGQEILLTGVDVILVDKGGHVFLHILGNFRQIGFEVAQFSVEVCHKLLAGHIVVET